MKSDFLTAHGMAQIILIVGMCIPAVLIYESFFTMLAVMVPSHTNVFPT
jgi:hypothetical protein